MNINTINALIEALQAKQTINKVLISTGKRDRRVEQIIKLCRRNRVIFQMVPQQTIARKAGRNNQGVYAEVSPIEFYKLDDVVSHIKSGIILILDGITDTGNMGAIIRSAVAAEVDAIIFSQRNSAPINETVLKTSAGALLKARLVQVVNITNAVKTLKTNGFWVVGTAVEDGANIPYYDYDFTVNTALIMGSEHKGLSPLIKKNADQIVYIPHSSLVDSINVSAAAAVVLFEAMKQKRQS